VVFSSLPYLNVSDKSDNSGIADSMRPRPAVPAAKRHLYFGGKNITSEFWGVFMVYYNAGGFAVGREPAKMGVGIAHRFCGAASLVESDLKLPREMKVLPKLALEIREDLIKAGMRKSNANMIKRTIETIEHPYNNAAALVEADGTLVILDNKAMLKAAENGTLAMNGNECSDGRVVRADDITSRQYVERIKLEITEANRKAKWREEPEKIRIKGLYLPYLASSKPKPTPIEHKPKQLLIGNDIKKKTVNGAFAVSHPELMTWVSEAREKKLGKHKNRALAHAFLSVAYCVGHWRDIPAHIDGDEAARAMFDAFIESRRARATKSTHH
jgi:hypothetical protein